ncbi:uncharacterized protein BDR25DRAFT_187722, partial [Lindgomyces ingoldianus]
TPATNATSPSIRSTCETEYPTELRLMSSQFPELDFRPGLFLMTMRQENDDRQWATQVQFQNMPNSSSVCRLELVLPSNSMLRIFGVSPVMNVYRVARAPSSNATWNTFSFAPNNKSQTTVFGSVNGAADAIFEVRQNGGVVVVGEEPCSETMTFQMGMAAPGQGYANYWDFLQVNPPAVPVQGWRVVHSC